MITVEDREQMRLAYFLHRQSERQIAKDQHHSRRTVHKALESAEAERYHLTIPRPAPVLGPYYTRLDELLHENETLPRKQRRTTRQMYLCLQQEGYRGSESSVRTYVWLKRKHSQRMEVFLPLEFDPGRDAQADWGEAEVYIADERLTAQLFVMRLCYSRRLFAGAYPTQRQEAFFDAHQRAFQCFGGVPHTVTYDNLTTAVQQVLIGHHRAEQRQFVALRSHFVFASRFCTPGEGHEKGGVESAVGYVRRNFLSPPPHFNTWDELNAHLLHCCQADEQRVVSSQSQSIGERFRHEQPLLGALPRHPFACCVTREVTLNPYSQVTFETNRYSVPADHAHKHLTLKAYPFQIVILHEGQFLTSHARCYGRNQEVVNWLDYLPLLAQRPGAFEHAKPLRQWREHWPPLYEQLLNRLQAEHAERDSAVREFVRILQLLREQPIEQVEAAIETALQYGGVHADGVRLCLHQLQQPTLHVPQLDLQQHPQLQISGQQRIEVQRYDGLLSAPVPCGTEGGAA